ncbi:MAG: hypothetical protein ACTHJN_20285 [Ginsengibacter sp.]
MKSIKIPKQDRRIFLKAARSLQLKVTRLNKVDDQYFDFYHCENPGLSQNDLFQLGVIYQILKVQNRKP